MATIVSTEWNTAEELQELILQGTCTTLKPGEKPPEEIESKWLMRPTVVNWVERHAKREGELHTRYINSVWLSVDPEIRVRQYLNSWHNSLMAEYKVCFKGSPDEDGMRRVEIEQYCLEDVWLKALKVAAKTAHPYHGSLMVPMKFWIYSVGDITYEIKSIDYGKEFQLEVEASTTEELKTLVLPTSMNGSIIKNVTSEDQYKLKRYWERTRLS